MTLHIYKNTLGTGPNAIGYPVMNALGIASVLNPTSTLGNTIDVNSDSVINWGCSKSPTISSIKELLNDGVWLNRPSAVATSSDKRKMYRALKSRGVDTFDFIDGSSTEEEIREFSLLPEDTVVRTLVNSHSGNGIVIVPRGELVPPASLYTKFKSLTYEWRVFVVGEIIVDILQKKKMTTEKLNEKGIEFNPVIRCNKNGWVYSRKNIVEMGPVGRTLALSAIDAIGLDFGAVDIGYTYGGNFIVVETNTAPGLENPTTITNFTSGLMSLLASKNY